MKKFILITTISIIFIQLLSVSSFAAEYNYNQFVTNSSVSGDNETVTLSLPVDQAYLWYTNSSGSVVTLDGPYFDGIVLGTGTFSLFVNPFGYNYIYSKDIPNGTVINYEFEFIPISYPIENPLFVFYCYADARGSNYEVIQNNRSAPITFDEFPEVVNISTTFNKTSDTKFFGCSFRIDLSAVSNLAFSLRIKSVSLTFDIPTLVQLQNQTGYTNDLLNTLSQQTGQTNELIQDTNDTLANIEEILREPMSPEKRAEILDKQEELDRQNEILNETIEQDRLVQEEANVIFDKYKEIEYDLFGDNYGQYVTEYVDPVFSNSGFINFWNGLWSNNYIIALVITALTFCGIGFAFYGVR